MSCGLIAGYEKELNDCFFTLNEGLNSRFTWRFKLDEYKPGELKSIYEKQVHDYGWTIAEGDTLPESWFASRMDYFTTYGRDMETLFTKTKILLLTICSIDIIIFSCPLTIKYPPGSILHSPLRSCFI